MDQSSDPKPPPTAYAHRLRCVDLRVSNFRAFSAPGMLFVGLHVRFLSLVDVLK